ncbi:hypothetical protein WICPIJ_000837 [Wickerhamomyces pijperi]|uniref:Uncharacterized protein n=1 Tax=Wickerhamomyces pijperi TaxID=599730 RepID=A0A9P8QFA9_WICPI|nr:hypothetical protein WICPIJ_000837 [Wickerhamomyces pijperi]
MTEINSTKRKKSSSKKGRGRKRRRTKKSDSKQKRRSFKSWSRNVRTTRIKKKKAQSGKSNHSDEEDNDGEKKLKAEKLRHTDVTIKNADTYNWKIQTSPYATTSISESMNDRKPPSLKELCQRKIADNVVHLDAEAVNEIPGSLAKDLWNKILSYQAESYTTFMNFALEFSKESWFHCLHSDLSKYRTNIIDALRLDSYQLNPRHRIFPLFDELTFFRFVNSLNAYDLSEHPHIVQVLEIRKEISREDLDYLIQNAKYLKSLKIGEVNRSLITNQFIYSLCQCLKNGKLSSLESLSLPILDEESIFELLSACSTNSLRYIEVASPFAIKRTHSHWTKLDNHTAISPRPSLTKTTSKFENFARNFSPNESWGIKTTHLNSLMHSSTSNSLIVHFIITPVNLSSLDETSAYSHYSEYNDLWSAYQYDQSYRFESVQCTGFYLHDLEGYMKSSEKESKISKLDHKNIAFTGVKKKTVKKRIDMDSYFD